MNIVIIEDELPAVRRLKKLIDETHPEMQVVAELDSIGAAMEWYAANPAPALTFCDIHLADGSAFALLDGNIITSPVILTTAYDEYALAAFKTASIAYLLKPIKQDELEAAIQKARQLKAMMTDTDPAKTPANTTYKTRFIVRFGEHLKSLMVSDIAYCYTESKATFARTFDGRTYPMDLNLDALEIALDPKHFFRLNRQYLIHINAIGEMRTYTKARVVVQLNPAVSEAPVVSSERAAAFKQWLADE